MIRTIAGVNGRWKAQNNAGKLRFVNAAGKNWRSWKNKLIQWKPTLALTVGEKGRCDVGENAERAVPSEALLACAGDAGCVPRGDCIMVRLRVPMHVNQWERKAVPLCA
ncbi:MAG: hypothetical protein WC331_10910, partial [Candidatus Omnitrophota bacterium]